MVLEQIVAGWHFGAAGLSRDVQGGRRGGCLVVAFFLSCVALWLRADEDQRVLFASIFGLSPALEGESGSHGVGRSDTSNWRGLARIERTPVLPVFPELPLSEVNRAKDPSRRAFFSADYQRDFQDSWRTARPGTLFSLARGPLNFGVAWRGGAPATGKKRKVGGIGDATSSKSASSFVWRHHTVTAPHSEVAFRWRRHNGATYGEEEISDEKLGVAFRLEYRSSPDGFVFRATCTRASTAQLEGVSYAKKQCDHVDFFLYWYNEDVEERQGSSMSSATSNSKDLFQVSLEDLTPNNSGESGRRSRKVFASVKTSSLTFDITQSSLQVGDGTQDEKEMTTSENQKPEACTLPAEGTRSPRSAKLWDFVAVWKECRRASKKKKGATSSTKNSNYERTDAGSNWVALRIPLHRSTVTVRGGKAHVNEEQEALDLEDEVEQKLAAGRADFWERMERLFPAASGLQGGSSTANDGQVSHEDETSHAIREAAVASLLGGIGTFEGSLLLKDSDGNERQRTSAVYRLKSGTPARAMFPRGFLWDEGFHGLVFAKWEEELFLEICLDWFSLQDRKTGWIPREVPLGLESESFVPDRFLGQQAGIMNPPTLLLGILQLVAKYFPHAGAGQDDAPNAVNSNAASTGESATTDTHEQSSSRRFTRFLYLILPHVAKWMEQWHLSQENVLRVPRDEKMPTSVWDTLQVLLHGPKIRDTREMERTFGVDEDTCYRWKDRVDEKHTLSSGLDDYPRGLFVNPSEECHLDNHVWFTLLVHSLERICGALSSLVDANDEALSPWCTALDYSLMGEKLRAGLYKQHWDAGQQILADFAGTQPVKKRKRKNNEDGPDFQAIVSPPWDGNGQCGVAVDALGRRVRKECEIGQCCSPSGWCGSTPEYCNCPQCTKFTKPLRDRPGYKKVLPLHSPHFGYVNLLPYVFGLEKLSLEDGRFLARMQTELFSPFGVRSLSNLDELSGKGENYWRGKIWANMNLLLFARMQSDLDIASRATEDQAELLADSLEDMLARSRDGFLLNVERNYRQHGNFFENFDPVTGDGTGALPFTGWTAAAYLLLSTTTASGTSAGVGALTSLLPNLGGTKAPTLAEKEL
ncbi:unnamed protein product [Amoebophrya sp. A25]|nr:unnamed protein product [Amoebophrya sp. A25]|eukprot:GSA25T00026970001.1